MNDIGKLTALSMSDINWKKEKAEREARCTFLDVPTPIDEVGVLVSKYAPFKFNVPMSDIYDVSVRLGNVREYLNTLDLEKVRLMTNGKIRVLTGYAVCNSLDSILNQLADASRHPLTVVVDETYTGDSMFRRDDPTIEFVFGDSVYSIECRDGSITDTYQLDKNGEYEGTPSFEEILETLKNI